MASLALIQTIFDLYSRSSFVTDTCLFFLALLILVKTSKAIFQLLEYEVSSYRKPYYVDC